MHAAPDDVELAVITAWNLQQIRHQKQNFKIKKKSTDNNNNNNNNRNSYKNSNNNNGKSMKIKEKANQGISLMVIQLYKFVICYH